MDDERPRIPSRGPELDLQAWARIATTYVRRYLPDVRASARGTAVSWRHGSRTAIVEAPGSTWFLTLYNDGRPTGAGLSIDRHDVFTAENLGGTLVGFFDADLSRAGHRRA